MREFMQWFYDVITVARSGSVWKDLVSLQGIVKAREAFCVERALGMIFFTTGRFDNMDDYLRYVESQDIANVTLSSAREHSLLVNRIYNTTIADIDRYVGGIRYMRYLVRSTVLDVIEPSLENATLWYDNMTVYLDALLSMQNDLSTDILAQLHDSEYKNAKSIIMVAILFTVMLLMCPLILNALYSFMSNIRSFSLTLAKRLRSLGWHIGTVPLTSSRCAIPKNSVRKQTSETAEDLKNQELNQVKKLMDTLAYKNVPTSMAERLHSKKDVKAQAFDKVTILISDIVSFTYMCTQSTPLQIVTMFNNLYTCVDRQIGLHDVYKLETMGDTHIITSGAPKRNGDKHVKEIADLALELIDMVGSLEAPHMHILQDQDRLPYK